MTLPSFWQQLGGMLPAVIVAITALVVMCAIAIKRSHYLVGTLSVVGLNIALLAQIGMLTGMLSVGTATSMLFSFDGFAMVNGTLVLIMALACCSLSYGFFGTFNDNKEELYLLMLISTLGAMLMTGAQHLASFFVSLELLSVPMYGMLAYTFLKQKSLESGLKYLVLSAAASATLLMGMAFILADVGQLHFVFIKEAILTQGVTPLVILGGSLMLVAIAFKLSLAPFHAWAGDVYQGAPAPISAFLASVAKVAAMALATRLLIETALPALPSSDVILTWLIVLSVIIGNLLALKQDNLKRLFAYSSIAHMGYALITLVSLGHAAVGLITMYMAVYGLTSLAAFGVMTVMTNNYRIHAKPDEAEKISDYQGIFWHRPILTAVMVVMILSMAGIPLTAGFITKFQVMFAAVQGGRFDLAIMLVVGSAIGLYYYLRVLLVMFKRPLTDSPFEASHDWSVKVGGIIVIIITLLIFVLGVLPNPLFTLASLSIIGV
ncbi:NADH-quinone oxidoreductase subunit N [Moraxella nasovis]|uniref:NADH-quinone oxidoreductase subunit N n=1 Tax=Moraxella nasovis TaxID=2904121 RepID=UPI0035CD21E4